MRIDFVSDIACPWCAVGFNSLERALEAIGDEIPASLAVQPFELNPSLGPEGADTVSYLSRKYGIDGDQIARNQAAIRARGAAVGFIFGDRPRVWNTFDAHRLLWWAGSEGPPGAQWALKHALLQAYHRDGRNPGDRDVLLELAASVGLQAGRAAEVIDRGEFAEDVRETEADWQEAGIRAVPAVIVAGRHLISGAQTPEVYARVLREIASRAGD